MADDITLTVRVQNRTAAGFAAVNNSVRQLQTRMVAASRTTHFEALNRSLRQSQAHLLTASRNSTHFGGALRQVAGAVGALRGGIGQAGAGLNRMTQVGAAGVGHLRSGLSRVGQGVGHLISGVGRATSFMADHKKATAYVALGWVGLTAGAPLLAAALTAGVGAAFIGLGAMALKGDRQVKAAFADMKTGVLSSVQEAAQPLKSFLVDGIQQVGAAARDLKPALATAFAQAGPLVEPLVRALTGLVSNVMPGFNAVLSRAKPVMEGLADAAASIGRGVSSFMDKLTSGNAQRMGDAFRTLGTGLEGVLASLGSFLGTVTAGDSSLKMLSTSLKTVELTVRSLGPVFKVLDAVMAPMASAIGVLQSGWEGVLDAFQVGTGSTDALGSSLGVLGAQTAASALASTSLASATTAANDAMREQNNLATQALGGMIGFEAAIDAAAEAADKHAGKLKVVNGEVALGSEGSRTAMQALLDLASATQQAADKEFELTGSQSAYNKILADGRKELIASTLTMTDSKSEAKKLADQILKTPDKTAKLKADSADLRSKLSDAVARLRTAPLSKKGKIAAEIGQLLSAVRSAKGAIGSVKGKSVTITTYVKQVGLAPVSRGVLKNADGGLIQGPGTGTSDDIPSMLSNGEFVVRASSVRKYGADFLERINSGSLRAFASGGKVSSAMKQARSEARAGLTISSFGQMAGYRNSEFANSLGSSDSVSELVSALNKWKSVIKAATSGGQEKRLLDGLSRAGGALIKAERLLLSTNKALDSAKTKLSSLKDSFAQMRDSVKSTVVGSGNITNGVSEGGGTAGVINRLRASVDKATSFAGALEKLKDRGLNKNSLAEIAAAGPDEGLKTAEALMGASKSDLNLINDLRSRLGKAGSDAGKTAADAMYGAGIKAAEGLVKGLQDRQDDIEKAMMKIAKSMEKAIEKALGIKGKATGGIAGGLTRINERGSELVRLPQGSMVYPHGQSMRMLGSGGGSSAPVHMHVSLGGKDLGEIVLDPLRKTIRTRGGNVQAVLGQRS